MHEYEARESLEAQAVKDLDLLEMIVQVSNTLSITHLVLQITEVLIFESESFPGAHVADTFCCRCCCFVSFLRPMNMSGHQG